MRFQKKFLDNMERCYSASFVNVKGQPHILLASEAIGGPCYAYSGENFEKKQTVWEKDGGTMSMVEIPGRDGEFLATQNFFPGFNSSESKVVWVRYENGVYVYQDFLKLPYLHRFDLLQSGGILYFVGATLCGSKKDRNDWSDPGKIYAAQMPLNLYDGLELKVLKEGLTKNHGYWRGTYRGKESGYVTGEEGIFAVTPPGVPGEDWSVTPVLEEPISDVAVFDLDGDGVDELVTIGPFHGKEVKIHKFIDGRYKAVWQCDRDNDFVHALWAGKLCEIPVAVVGSRRGNCELYYVRYNRLSGEYELTILEEGAGTANVAVLHQENRDILIAANHTKNEAALYYFTKE